MSYFNTTTYDASNSSYNSEFPIYIDGTTSSIPINGAKYCGNVCGNVMASFVVDNGDSILNGNLLLTQNLNIGGGINILPTITTTTSNVVSISQGTSTFISGNTIAYLAGTTSNIQLQLNNSINQTAMVSDLSTSFTGGISSPSGVYFGSSVSSANHSVTVNPYSGQLNLLGYYGGILSTYAGDAFLWDASGISINGSINGIANSTFAYISSLSSDVQTQLDKLRITSVLSATTGTHNYCVGEYNLPYLTTGSYNSCVGCNNQTDNISGSRNISMGNTAGTGMLGSDTVCIGTNAGCYPATNYNSSVCIGAQSRITASNQVVLGTSSETVVIPGSLTVYDGNTSLSYDSSSNGVQLKGYAGGVLKTSTSTPLWWNYTGTTTTGIAVINGSINMNGYINMHKAALYLNTLSDPTHSLVYDTNVNGPLLKGYGGGALATPSNNALTWTSHGCTINGTLSVTSGKVIMNDLPIYFRTPTLGNIQTPDTNHSIGYDASLNGVRLKAYVSGALATASSGTDILTWDNSGVTILKSITTSSITTPTSNPLLSITGNVSVLPYNSNTTLTAYTVKCNAVQCFGQITASGQGVQTIKLQCSANGTGILGLQTGSFQATTNGTQTVTFANQFIGSSNAPLVFLQVVYAGIGYCTNAPYVVSSTVNNFTYNFSFSGTAFVHAEKEILINYVAYQI
jgi:hypothetical protein